jgi:ketosteroid isomerase-like protein
MKEATSTTTIESEIMDAVHAYTRAAREAFKGNLNPMVDVWSHSNDVTLLDPSGGRHVGWDAVRGFIEQLTSSAQSGECEARDVLIRGDKDMAYVVANEDMNLTMKSGQSMRFTQRSTVIFRREGGSWKMIHHHDDVSSAMQGMGKK